jgi:hypothetical protein
MKFEADESKLRKRMDDLHKNIDIMKGDKFRITDINLDYIKKELLTPIFMEKHTKFSSFDMMIKSSEFKIENELEFKDASNSTKWNEYIIKSTEFKNWNEMLRIAVLERATRKLMSKKV